MKKIIIAITVLALVFLLAVGANQKYHEYKTDTAWSIITRDADEDDVSVIETDDYTIRSYIIREEMR